MGGKKIKQQEVRGCEEETQALFYQVTSLHIPAGSYVLSLRLSQGPATGPSLCQIYPLHSFISSFFNIYSNSILLSTSVTPTYSLRVLQLNFRTVSPKCYVYYIKCLKTLCNTLCIISSSYSGWCSVELIYWYKFRLS